MSAHDDYVRYRQLRGQLVDVLDGVGAVANALSLSARAGHLSSVRARLENSRFRLMVLGEFKRGKSTLVNAMLGATVLPTRVAPCTGMITVVRYGDPASARLLGAEPGAAPIDVPLDRIREHITIAYDDVDDDEAPPAPSAARFELAYPLPLLAEGVELVDSPGLNEHAVRTALALEDLPHADAVVLVLSCEQQLGHTERGFIDQQLVPGPDGGLSNVFFVWNRYDTIAQDPAEVAALDALTADVLEPRLGGRSRVFKVSARDALIGRVKEQPERLAASGLPVFESGLAHFLTTERARAKMLGPSQAAAAAIADLCDNVLPEREALLRAPVDALEERLDELAPRLVQVRRRREALVRALASRRAALARRLRVKLGMFGAQVHDGLPEAIDKVQVQWAGAAWNRRGVLDALREYLATWLDAEAATFERDHIRPTLEREAQELDALLEEQLGHILSELDQMRSGLVPRMSASKESGPDMTATERVLSALGGFVMGGPGGAVEGATFGWRNVVGGLPVYLGVGVALALSGASLPIALSVVTGVGVLRTWLTGKGKAERLRDDVLAGFQKAFDRELGAMSARVEDEVSARYQRLIDAVDAATEAVIVELEEELTDVRRRHEDGQQTLESGLAELGGHRRRLDALARALAAVEAGLVG